MSRKWSNRNLPGALHFVTGNVQGRKPIFRTEAPCIAFLQVLQELRTKIGCKLITFVLMPDHFHLVVNPRDGNIREWIGALKALSANNLIAICPADSFGSRQAGHKVWQDGFKALPLWSGWMVWQKINYIHSNPIRSGLVESTADYRLSSFHSFCHRDTDPLLQVDGEWSWPDDVQKLKRSIDEWAKKKEQERVQSSPS